MEKIASAEEGAFSKKRNMPYNETNNFPKHYYDDSFSSGCCCPKNKLP